MVSDKTLANYLKIWKSLRKRLFLGFLKVLLGAESYARWANGKESTVNRALGGCTYPG
jgi:hypothetical protein